MSLFKKDSANAYRHPFEETIARLLREAEFHATYNADYRAFELDIRGKNCQFRTIVCYFESRESLVLRSFLPLEIRDESKLKIAELISRINDEIHVGGIKFDWEDNRCYVETVHVLQPAPIAMETFKRLLNCNLTLTDDSFVHILNVNVGNDEPLLAALKMLNAD